MITSEARRPWHTAALIAATIAFFGADSRTLHAQADAAKKPVPKSSKKTLVTQDGWQLAITYYMSTLGQNSPVVVLLHRLNGDRLVWEGKQGFAERLNREGYAVVTVDLRKHGESKSPTGGGATDSSNLKTADYQRMIDNDLEAVKDFLYKEHQAQNLNMNKMAIIAPESSAPIAINFTAYDWLKEPYPDGPSVAASTPRGQDVRALVLLSPQANLRGLTSQQAILQIRNPEWGIANLTCVGTDDDQDKGEARKIYAKLAGVSGAKDRVYLESYPSKFRGTDLLGKKNVNSEEDILFFLKKHLLDLPSDWRDRKNRLTGK